MIVITIFACFVLVHSGKQIITATYMINEITEDTVKIRLNLVQYFVCYCDDEFCIIQRDKHYDFNRSISCKNALLFKITATVLISIVNMQNIMNYIYIYL